MEQLTKVQFGNNFDAYNRDEIKINGNENRSIETVFTEAVLHIQKSTKHKIVTTEMSHEMGSNNAWFKKNRRHYEDVILKVVVRIQKEDAK